MEVGLNFLNAGFTPKPFVADSDELTMGSGSSRKKGRQFEELISLSWATFHVIGDEATEGPIYNYARVLTWWKFSAVIEKTFEALISSLRGQKNCRNEEWAYSSSPETNLSGTASDISRFCGLDRANLDAYPEWKDIESNVWHQIAIAAEIAMWVQWGTTGKTKPAPELMR